MKEVKIMPEPLEATEIRKDIWNTCKRMGDECKGCPYRYTCEDYFPFIGHLLSWQDCIPADYVLNEDGTMFIIKD